MLTPEQINQFILCQQEESVLLDAMADLTYQRIRKDDLFFEILKAMKAHCESDFENNHLDTKGEPVLDFSSTGEGRNSVFNLSLPALFILKAGKVNITKSLNFKDDSIAATLDILEKQGVNLPDSAERATENFKHTGLCLLSADTFYPKLSSFARSCRLYATGKHVDLPLKTRLISLLINPAQPSHLLMSIREPEMVPLLSDYLCQCDTVERALILYSPDEPDIATNGKTHLVEVNSNTSRKDVIHTSFHTQTKYLRETLSGDKILKMSQDIINGKDTESLYYWQSILFAGAGLYLTEKSQSISEGMQLAHQLIKEGQAQKSWEQLMSNTEKVTVK